MSNHPHEDGCCDKCGYLCRFLFPVYVLTFSQVKFICFYCFKYAWDFSFEQDECAEWAFEKTNEGGE